MSETQKPKSHKIHHNRAEEVVNTFEWLITAFILAFFFRAFVMEAFRIPTGSMADTLMGAHFRLCCPQCGYKYEYGFVPQEYRMPQDTIPAGNVAPPRTRCPSCGYYPSSGTAMPISNGDRVLVLKCLYQFFEPKQWDVVVFKNPLEPQINYIKRLIGRPGETLEIIDGDIYINGKISRKPTNVQEELWMPVYNNDYQPVRPREGIFNGHAWRIPFNFADSGWKINEDSPAKFQLDSPADQINTMSYDTSIGNDFRTAYAYDDVRDYSRMPYCSDLMVRLYAASMYSSGSAGRLGVSLSKYQSTYKAWVDLKGEMVIARTQENADVILSSKPITISAMDKPIALKFANVDHQLIFEFGGEKLTYDLGQGPDDAGNREINVQPQVKIFGSGKLTVSHLAIFRDIHYTNVDGPGRGRATEGNPLKLEKDEFFMLGDNSPNSADSRWWSENGKGNNRVSYRQGIVPREYLVGKAVFVYWPSGFKPFEKFRFALVPNIGRMRFICGGSDKNP